MGNCQRYFWDDIVESTSPEKKEETSKKEAHGKKDKGLSCTCHGMEDWCIC